MENGPNSEERAVLGEVAFLSVSFVYAFFSIFLLGDGRRRIYNMLRYPLFEDTRLDSSRELGSGNRERKREWMEMDN
jgi:hypothetical protein